jgi:hypothetical protein
MSFYCSVQVFEKSKFEIILEITLRKLKELTESVTSLKSCSENTK